MPAELEACGSLADALRRTLAADRLSPSYLFEGVDARMLREAAESFAAAILSVGHDEDERARTQRRIVAGTHPDLHVLEKDKPTVISVSALEPVLEEAHSTPVEGRYQVFIVDPADAMEPEGIARYLKSLEEPPPGTVFLLVTTRVDRLPDTVLSRCRRLRLAPLPADDVAARLDPTLDEPTRDAIVRWSGRSLDRALRMSATGIVEIVHSVADIACAEPPRVAAGAETVLAAVEQGAGALTDDAGTKRQAVREVLADLLHAVAVEARDRAAGRASVTLPTLGPRAAVELLRSLETLSRAVPTNVTPSVVVLELLDRVRAALQGS